MKIPQLEHLCCCSGCMCTLAQTSGTACPAPLRCSAQFVSACLLLTNCSRWASSKDVHSCQHPFCFDCPGLALRACASLHRHGAVPRILPGTCLRECTLAFAVKQCATGVCLGVAQACSSPKVQRCLADVAEHTECQCKLATDILLSASAVGTPVQACTDVAYALYPPAYTTHRKTSG
jgi:hypothetical protein